MPITFRDSYKRPEFPTGFVTECKTTYVKAFGKATAVERTSPRALAAAKREALVQLATAIAEAQALKCPQGTKSCRGICDRGRTLLRGIGSERSRARRLAPFQWQITFTAWRSFDVVCRCRG